jgi:uncharacterized Fe-S center protein
MSKVYLAPVRRTDPEPDVIDKVSALWEQADLRRSFQRNDLAALKLHVGEPGTRPYLSPGVLATLVRLIGETGARPFLTDTAVLYGSARDTGLGHARVAVEHGFGMERVGAPFVPADGLTGSDEVEIEVGGKHFDQVAIASAIVHARSMLVLSHATGHLGTGFGGAVKNLGMGCSSKKGKLRQHHGQQPRIDPRHCDACAACVGWCPTDSIEVDEAARIDEATCIGCGSCIAACQEGAVEFDWAIMGRELQERIAEYAAGVVRGKDGRIGYVTVATGITKDCDCLGLDQDPVVEDLGILASHDPVAIDLAVLDLIQEREGRSLESLSYPHRDGRPQLTYAASLGLGESRFELVTVD